LNIYFEKSIPNLLFKYDNDKEFIRLYNVNIQYHKYNFSLEIDADTETQKYFETKFFNCNTSLLISKPRNINIILISEEFAIYSCISHIERMSKDEIYPIPRVYINIICDHSEITTTPEIYLREYKLNKIMNKINN
jgi:hypothetical protein